MFLADGLWRNPAGAGPWFDLLVMSHWAMPDATMADALAGLSAGWSAQFDRKRHRNLINVVFFDGHAESLPINTVAPALAPLEVEQQITLPVELAIGGLPGLQNVRSVSKFGFSQVVATFDDATGIYLARQLVSERLQGVELPAGLGRPQLGPISTGLGDVFHYTVTSGNPERTLTELRELHDWVVKPELRKVPGVAEVNSWGGFEKQFHVIVEPERLIKHGLTLEDVFEALEANNQSVGGGQVVSGGESLLVHGIGLATDLEQIGNIVIGSHDGVPVRVHDVARVEIGHEIRRGAVTADGKGEAVLGLGFMLMGENSHVVTRKLKAQLAEARKALPADVKVETVYDRTELVDKVIRTVEHNLLAGALLVIAVLFAFLGNLRAGLIVASAIPLAMLFAGNYMMQAGIAASLLSLGAIDFGLIVDSSVIMVENCARHIAKHGRDRPPGCPSSASGAPGGRALPTTNEKSRLDIIRDAALEVRKPTMFGELIIMIVFLQILTLEGVEGKLFRPMALTMIAALLGSLVLSLTLMPVLASLVLPKNLKETEPWLVRLAGISVEEAVEYNTRIERLLLIVATGIPFSAVGGVAALALRGMPFTVSAGIGFVSLSGVAMLNGLVLVTFIQQRLRAGVPLAEAVREACQVRLRPVLMTALVAAVGFIPMAVNTGIGAEVQRPLATVVIGGILSDTVLTLLVLPVLYSLFGRAKAAQPTGDAR